MFPHLFLYVVLLSIQIKTQDQQEQGQYWTLPLDWNTPAPGDDYVPYQLKRKRREKRKVFLFNHFKTFLITEQNKKEAL